MPRGPRPMHPGVRQRQNVTATRGELPVLPVADRARIEVPALPSDRLWDPKTSEFWVDAWQSPMRLEWDPADAHGLLQIAYMLELFWEAIGQPLPGDHGEADEVTRLQGLKARTDAVTKLSAQIMNRCARLGVDPFARRSLQWMLVKIEQGEAERDNTKARTAKTRAETAATSKRRGLAGLQ